MTDTKCPSLFDWGNNDLNLPKRVTDDQMIADIMNHPLGKSWINKHIKVVTLSGATFTFEKILSEIFKKIKFTFYPIERNIKVFNTIIQTYFSNIDIDNFYMFKAQLEHYKNSEIVMLSKPETVYEYFSTPKFDLIDYINLDYMGTWSKEKQNDFIKLFSCGFLKDEIFISLTISGNRGHNNDELYDMAKEMKSKVDVPKIKGTVKNTIAKTLGVISNVEKISKSMGYTTQCLRIYPYIGYNKTHTEYKFLFYSKRA